MANVTLHLDVHETSARLTCRVRTREPWLGPLGITVALSVGMALAAAFCFLGWQTGSVHCIRAVSVTCTVAQHGPLGVFSRAFPIADVLAASVESNDGSGAEGTSALVLRTPAGRQQVTRFPSAHNLAKYEEQATLLRGFLADPQSSSYALDVSEWSPLPFGFGLGFLLMQAFIVLGAWRSVLWPARREITLDRATAAGHLRIPLRNHSFALHELRAIEVLQGAAAMRATMPALAILGEVAGAGANLTKDYAAVMFVGSSRTVGFPLIGQDALRVAEELAARVTQFMRHG